MPSRYETCFLFYEVYETQGNLNFLFLHKLLVKYIRFETTAKLFAVKVAALSRVKKGGWDTFLAPTGAQEMALSVRLSVRLCVRHFYEFFTQSSLTLHSILKQS